MKLVSLDPLRTWDMPGIQRIKAEAWQKNLPLIKAADWILFPEYWQINVFYYALKKRIFPSVNSYHLGYTKVEMTYAFQTICPENVPYTRILPRTDGNISDILDEFTFPFVAKEVRNSMGRGVFLIEDKSDFQEYVAQNGMLYVQEYLPLEKDLRVVIVGRDVVTAYWRIAQEGGFYNNVARGGAISFEDVPETAVALVQQVAHELDIDHAGFDVAMVDGHPYLLEFNMRFGNQALTQQKIRLGPLVKAYLESRDRGSGSGDRGEDVGEGL